jgi:exodeoxyribonuclease VII small subunit
MEADLKRLERVVERLGSGEVSLTDAQRLYAEGMRLVKACRTRLKEVRGQVLKLNKETGGLEPLDLEGPE